MSYDLADAAMERAVFAERRSFFKAPSGRIHGMKRCSGCGVKMRHVLLSRNQFNVADRCRCANWRDDQDV